MAEYTWSRGPALAGVYNRNPKTPKGEQMAVGDLIKLNFVQSIFGDVIENNFYYKVEADDISNDNEDALADQFNTDVVPVWQPVVTADLSMDCIGTQKVLPTPLTAFRDKFINAVGTATGEALPIVVTALLQKFLPSLSGQGKKGHTFISGISEAQTAKGRILSSLQTSLIALAAKLNQTLTTPSSGEYNPVWATFSATPPRRVDGSVDWTKTVVLPRLSHISTRKTPIRKIAT